MVKKYIQMFKTEFLTNLFFCKSEPILKLGYTPFYSYYQLLSIDNGYIKYGEL